MSQCLCLFQDILLERFAQRCPSCVAYDEKMHVYSSVAKEISSHQTSKRVEFCLLDIEPMTRALQDNARCWVTSLGKLLNESAKVSFTALASQLQVSHRLLCSNVFQVNPNKRSL